MRFAFLAVVFLAGCLRSTSFHCATNDQCGAGGTCVTSVGGFCAFPDPACAGGKFGPQAGDLSNTCVGSPGGDGGFMDAPKDGMGSGSGDANPNHCPSGYAMVTGGNPGHNYKVITGTDNWQNQADACTATAPQFAHLAIPDDAAELAALDTLAGGAAQFWVGVRADPQGNGTWVTVKNQNQNFLPWDAGQPDTTMGKDCVEGVTANGKLATDRCNTQLAAVCECD